ncbi:sugar ABC transporter permease [Myxococcota bacterium]|nr:sugar ABC transporter permease [Myxococcota bacterium]
MRPAVKFFAVFGAIATAAFFLLGVGQRYNDGKTLAGDAAITVARAIAFVAASEVVAFRSAPEPAPAAEGQPAPEVPEPGVETQQFVAELKTKLGVTRALVLEGTQYFAHADPALAKQRLSRDSVDDKALYDRASSIKNAVSKNAEEREANPARTSDAFPELSIEKLPDGRLRAAVPVLVDGQFESLAELDMAPVVVALPMPWLVLAVGLGFIVLFVGAGAVMGGALEGKGKSAIAATALVVSFAVQGHLLATWRAECEQVRAAKLAAVHSELVAAGLFAGPRAKLDPVPVLADTSDGSVPGLVAILPKGRSATTAAALSAPHVAFTEAASTSYWSKDYFDRRFAEDRANLALWTLGISILALLGFVLGMLGQLAKAKAALHEHRSAYKYMAPAGLGLLVLVFVPVTYALALGFYRESYNVYEFAGLTNYIEILAVSDFTAPSSFYFKLGVTVLWTITNVALHVSIGLFLALLLNDQLLKAKGIYRVLLIVPWAIPNYITALIWKGMFHKQFGAVNFFLDAFGVEAVAWFQTFWTAFATNLVTNTWLGFPFMMVISLGALQSIPSDLYEAARVDGASRWQRFKNITLPLLMPALVPSVIVGSVWTFNMFNIIFLVSGGAPDGETDILITEAYRWAFERNQDGYAAAYSTLIFIILLAFSLATNKITGATKGVFE